MNSVKAVSVLSFFTGLAAAWPMNTTSSSTSKWVDTSSSKSSGWPTTTTYACNPAHSYPGGASCISTAGSLTLVTPTASTTSYACNPAHSYPGGASCISTAGSLTLVTPTANATSYACNPAHSYPGGASCISTAGSLTLVTPTQYTTTTTVYTTDVVTVCPTPTVVTIGTKTITVTSATTLTVPCPTTATITVPINAASTSSAAASATPSGNCKVQENACRTAPMANQAYCSSQLASCQGSCYAAYNVCRTTRGPDGLSANFAQCASEYANCLGENPIASTGGIISSFLPYTATAASSTVWVTKTTVYTTDYVTVCPTPTVVTINSQTITVTKSTTLTVPCPTTATISTAVVVGPTSPSAPPASASAPPASSAAPPASGTTCPAAQTVVVTQYVTVTAQPPASSKPAPPTSSKPAPPASSKPAQSSMMYNSTSTAPAPKPTSKCPLDLPAGTFEYPHGLRVNGVNGYNIVVSKDSKTDVTFDIPQGDAGKTCNTYFTLPNAADLETSSYTLSGSGKIDVSKNGKVIYSFAPQPNNKYLIESGACAAGQAVTYTLSTADSVSINLFNDYNPCPLGAFVTVA